MPADVAAIDASALPNLAVVGATRQTDAGATDGGVDTIFNSTLSAIHRPRGPRLTHDGASKETPALSPPLAAPPPQTLSIAEDLSGGQTESSSSITVLSREAIRTSGAVNLRDLLRQLTSNAGAPDSVDVGISGRSGVDSVAGFNLRGMGGGATLVLLNGRRLVSSAAPVREGTDINAIPLAVVERIEIVRGGTSAIYGSNAVAGVINIITRQDFEGVHVEGKLGGTTGLDYGLAQASMTTGSVSEFGSVQFGAGYARQTALSNSSRNFTKTIQQTSLFGNPGTILSLNSDSMIQATPDPRCGTAQAPNSFRLLRPGQGDPEDRARQAKQSGLTESQLEQEYRRAHAAREYLVDVCRYNFNPYFDLITPIERFNAFGSAVYEVGESTSMFAEVVTSYTASSPRASPSFPATRLGRLDRGSGGASSDPFVWLGRPLTGNEAVRNRQSQNSFRVVAGLRGELGASKQSAMPGNWQWELSGTVSSSRYSSSYRDAILDRLEHSLKPGCESMNAGDPDICLNILRDPSSENRKALTNYLFGEQRSDNITTLSILNANLTGELLQLPAGPVDLAIAVEGRREAREARVGQVSREKGFAFLLGSDGQDDQRYIGAGSLEVGVPVTKGLSTQLAARLDRYTKLGTFLSPKAGFLLNLGKISGSSSPSLNRLHIRGTFAQGFAAPSLLAMADGSRALPSSQRYQGQPLMLPNLISGNPNLKMEQATTLSAGVDFQWRNIFFIELNYYFSNNKNAVTTDDPRHTLAICDRLENPARTECEGALSHYSPISLNRTTAGEEPIVSFGEGIEGIIDDRPQKLHSYYRNGARYRTNGVDFHIETRIPIGGNGPAGRNHVDATAAYLSARGTFLLGYHLIQRGYEIHFMTDKVTDKVIASPRRANLGLGNVAGKRNFTNSAPALPRLRLRIPIGIRGLGHDVRLVTSFLSAIQNDEQVDQFPYGSIESGETGRDFPARVTFDFGYSYTTHAWLGKTTTLRIDVINLGGLLPPKRYTNDGTDLSIYDPRGRMVQLSLSQDL